MPPMPGTVYHPPGQQTAAKKSTELPPELKKIDNQIQQDVTALKGGGKQESKNSKNEVAGAAGNNDTRRVESAAKGNDSSTKDQGAVKDSGGIGVGAIIAGLAAAFAMAIFFLRKRTTP